MGDDQASMPECPMLGLNSTDMVEAQLLACLKWLSEFEILAFVPAQDQVSYQDTADLADVPVQQLSRIVRFTAASGFLRETGPGTFAHSKMSAQFADRPSLLDAVSFVSE